MIVLKRLSGPAHEASENVLCLDGCTDSFKVRFDRLKEMRIDASQTQILDLRQLPPLEEGTVYTVGADGRNRGANGTPIYSMVPMELTVLGPNGQRIVCGASSFTLGDNNPAVQKNTQLLWGITTIPIEGKERPLQELSLYEMATHLGTIWQALKNSGRLAWTREIHHSSVLIFNTIFDAITRCMGVSTAEYVSNISYEEQLDLFDFTFVDSNDVEAITQFVKEKSSTRKQRCEELKKNGMDVYNTAGWSGIPIDTLIPQMKGLQAEGLRHFKMKVGVDHDEEKKRFRAMCEQMQSQADLDAHDNQAYLMIDYNFCFSSNTLKKVCGEVKDFMEIVSEYPAVKFLWVEEPEAPGNAHGYQRVRAAFHRMAILEGDALTSILEGVVELEGPGLDRFKDNIAKIKDRDCCDDFPQAVTQALAEVIQLEAASVSVLKKNIQSVLDKNLVETAGGEQCQNLVEAYQHITSRSKGFGQYDTARMGLPELLTVYVLQLLNGDKIATHAGGIGLNEKAVTFVNAAIAMLGTPNDGLPKVENVGASATFADVYTHPIIQRGNGKVKVIGVGLEGPVTPKAKEEMGKNATLWLKRVT